MIWIGMQKGEEGEWRMRHLTWRTLLVRVENLLYFRESMSLSLKI